MTELAFSHALIAPANPMCSELGDDVKVGSGESGWVDRAMKARAY